MKFFTAVIFVFAVLVSGTFASAQSLVEEDYTGKQDVTTPWYVHYSKANYDADQGFITGMRPHHAGALSMSKEYLASGEKSSSRLQSLANGIIRNQEFEILMLDTIEKHINDIDFSNGEGWYQVGEQGLAKRNRFIRSPVPGIQQSFNGDDVVSAEDVRFAKAMIVHHEAALIMADDYINNDDSNNGYLERMCLDILRDQKQEIQLMHNIIAAYPGDADAIKIDPSMVHGMDGMMHHMDLGAGKMSGHGGHGGHAGH